MDRFGSSFWQPRTIAAALRVILVALTTSTTGAAERFGQHRAAVRAERVEAVEQSAIGFDQVDPSPWRRVAETTDLRPSVPIR